MSATESVNIASLNMVQSELIATIEESANLIEEFSGDRDNSELLQGCVAGIKQIRSILNLIELKGVNLLAEELVIHIQTMAQSASEKNSAASEKNSAASEKNSAASEKNSDCSDNLVDNSDKIDRQLELISAAFFMLPRYLEYCVQTSRNMGMLLIPQINELRQARRVAPLPESYYFDFDPAPIARTVTPAVAPEASAELVRRLRFMYQTGMLKVLQGTQIKPSLGIMCRALERLSAMCGVSTMGNFWWLADATLSALSEEGIAITKSRKMVLSTIDREIKNLESEGKLVFERMPAASLIKELLYLLVLSKSSSEKTQAVIAAYAVPLVSYSDAELTREMEFLCGPSTSTINSMVALLNDEIKSTKNMLEHSAQGAAELNTAAPELIVTLNKISEILALVGLVVPSKSLKQEVEKLRSWQMEDNTVANRDLLSIADTLLYVESTVAGLGKTNMSDEKLTQINALERDYAMANNQIVEAERLVIDEAESGVAIVKRALSAFAESNYDRSHIATIATTLDGVRGGMFVLGLPRAAKVLAGCIAFISQSLMFSEHPATTQHLLETFADAIVSLEYYLDSLKISKDADTDVLCIAEESLAVLGYKI